MPNQINEKRFTFTEAALAAGLTPKQLRNWLDKERGYGLVLDAETERPGDGWRRFSIVDVLRINFIGAAVEFCISVKDAAQIIETVISKKLNFLITYKNTPMGVILATFKQSWLTIWRDRNGKLEHDIAPAVHMVRGGLLPPKFIAISLYDLAAKVFERLGLDEDRPEGTITPYETVSNEEYLKFEKAHLDSVKELMGLFELMKEQGQFGPEQLEHFRKVRNEIDWQMKILDSVKPVSESEEAE